MCIVDTRRICYLPLLFTLHISLRFTFHFDTFPFPLFILLPFCVCAFCCAAIHCVHSMSLLFVPLHFKILFILFYHFVACILFIILFYCVMLILSSLWLFVYLLILFYSVLCDISMTIGIPDIYVMANQYLCPHLLRVFRLRIIYIYYLLFITFSDDIITCYLRIYYIHSIPHIVLCDHTFVAHYGYLPTLQITLLTLLSYCLIFWLFPPPRYTPYHYYTAFCYIHHHGIFDDWCILMMIPVIYIHWWCILFRARFRFTMPTMHIRWFSLLHYHCWFLRIYAFYDHFLHFRHLLFLTGILLFIHVCHCYCCYVPDTLFDVPIIWWWYICWYNFTVLRRVIIRWPAMIFTLLLTVTHSDVPRTYRYIYTPFAFLITHSIVLLILLSISHFHCWYVFARLDVLLFCCSRYYVTTFNLLSAFLPLFALLLVHSEYLFTLFTTVLLRFPVPCSVSLLRAYRLHLLDVLLLFHSFCFRSLFAFVLLLHCTAFDAICDVTVIRPLLPVCDTIFTVRAVTVLFCLRLLRVVVVFVY